MSTSDPADVLAYQSRLPGGREALAFLNTNTSSAKTVTFSPGTPLSGQLRTWTYSAGNQNAANSNIVQGAATASSVASGISLPPESLVILQSSCVIPHEEVSRSGHPAAPAGCWPVAEHRAARLQSRAARDRGGALATRGGQAPLVLPYRRRNCSTRPAVSRTRVCPVKNGWLADEISTSTTG
jgi:hypothetical protein